MATERLQVVLSMAAGQYKSEARQAAQATGKISTEASKAGVATGKMSTQMSGLAQTARFAIAGAATAAVVGFARDSIRAASDLEESINAVNVTFGDAADEVLKIGDSAASSFGLAKSEFNGFAVQFSSFATTISTGSGKTVDTVIGDLTTRIADFASVMNLDVPLAAQKFQSGLAGQTEPLRAFGIDVSAAAVGQKALELGLANSTSELTEQDKVLARYELIMGQTDKTAGDFANTSDSLANSQRILAARTADAQAAIGSKLLPVVSEATDAFADLVTVIDGLVSLIPGIEGVGEAVKFAFNQALFGIPDLLDVAAGWFDDLGDATDGAVLASAVFGTEQQILKNELIDSADKVLLLGNRYRDLETSVEDLAESEKEAAELAELHAGVLAFEAEVVDKVTAALRRKMQALSNIHNPLFRAVELNEDLAEAEEAVLEAESKFGRGSTEFRDATIARARIISDLTDTLLELQEEGIDPTGAAAEAMLKNMGIPDEVIAEIFADIDAVKAYIEGTNPLLTVDMFINDSALPSTIRSRGSLTQRHSGGPIRAGQSYIVGERGPELFRSDQSGQMTSSADLARLLAGVSSSNTYNGGTQNITLQSTGDTARDAQVVSLMLANRSLVRGGLRGGAF